MGIPIIRKSAYTAARSDANAPGANKKRTKKNDMRQQRNVINDDDDDTAHTTRILRYYLFSFEVK